MVCHEALEGKYPPTFDLYLRSHFVCLCAKSRLNGGSSAVYPPSVCHPPPVTQKHTRQMLACQYKDMQIGRAERTFQRIEELLQNFKAPPMSFRSVALNVLTCFYQFRIKQCQLISFYSGWHRDCILVLS